MVDEMAIKQQIEWDGKNFVGFVDIGSGVDDDTAPVATEALVLLVVSLNGHLKVPVGFFSSKGYLERKEPICLLKLHDVGV